MSKKRRNNGRAKKNRGHDRFVRCINCGRVVPKDKAVKRYTVRNMVDASSLRDLKENSAFAVLVVPKFYTKLEYCISCAIHARIVKVRSAKDRRNRDPPARAPRPKDDDRKKTPAPPAPAAAAVVA